jgi:MFS family permease
MSTPSFLQWLRPRYWAAQLTLPATDLLRDGTYRRLWTSILISSLGGQITLLALPLTAAVLLHASPTEMGYLTAAELVPYVLLGLPAGVWLDRAAKLPIYIVGELAIAVAVGSVPLAWYFDKLSIVWLCTAGFLIGSVNTIAGSASQIVLTQIVPRERLVEAHAKNTLANSTAEVLGPAAAGALIKLLGPPLALLADVALLLMSALILRGIRVTETLHASRESFWPAMRAGVDFVRSHSLLVAMAITVGGWQFCNQAATVVQILVATRELGLSARSVGFSYIALGFGTIGASALGHRVAARIGSGPMLILGFVLTGAGWLLLAVAPANRLGIAAYAVMLLLFGIGAVFIFINFLSLRQAVTPAPMLGRMTTTMRWLSLLPGAPGALWGGWLGEHLGLRISLAFAGSTSLLLGIAAWRLTELRRIRALPGIQTDTPP